MINSGKNIDAEPQIAPQRAKIIVHSFDDINQKNTDSFKKPNDSNDLKNTPTQTQ